MNIKDPYTNERRYFNLYTPATATTNENEQFAVLISLHGYTGDAGNEQWADLFNTRLNKRNVAVAYG